MNKEIAFPLSGACAKWKYLLAWRELGLSVWCLQVQKPSTLVDGLLLFVSLAFSCDEACGLTPAQASDEEHQYTIGMTAEELTSKSGIV